MVIAFVLSVSLGAILWVTSTRLLHQSQLGAQQGRQIVELGEVVVGESRKVSAVVRMNIIRDPIYQDNPELLEAFNSDALERDRLLDEQRATLERQRASLDRQASELRGFRTNLAWVLFGALSLLVLGIGAGGIFVTHKIAGPIFKLKRHLKEVTVGELKVPWGLRKGDELVDLFDTFREMVGSLRRERENQIERVAEISQQLIQDERDAAKLSLERLHTDLKKGLL